MNLLISPGRVNLKVNEENIKLFAQTFTTVFYIGTNVLVNIGALLSVVFAGILLGIINSNKYGKGNQTTSCNNYKYCVRLRNCAIIILVLSLLFIISSPLLDLLSNVLSKNVALIVNIIFNFIIIVPMLGASGVAIASLIEIGNDSNSNSQMKATQALGYLMSIFGIIIAFMKNIMTYYKILFE
jgi:hypothetical protein